MTAWLAMTVAAVASSTIGNERPMRIEQEERVFDAAGIGEHKRALAEIVDRQRRQRHEQPRDPDRPASEMAEIGVERFRAGHHQEHGAQRKRPIMPW